MTLDWKSLFSGAGRIDRTTFWTVQLLLAIAQACLRAAMLLFPVGLVRAGFLVFLVASSVVGVFNLAKRLHDLGRSGWWMLVLLAIGVLVVGLAAVIFGPASNGALTTEGLVLLTLVASMLVVGLLKGNSGPNRYGEPLVAKASAVA